MHQETGKGFTAIPEPVFLPIGHAVDLQHPAEYIKRLIYVRLAFFVDKYRVLIYVQVAVFGNERFVFGQLAIGLFLGFESGPSSPPLASMRGLVIVDFPTGRSVLQFHFLHSHDTPRLSPLGSLLVLHGRVV